jgi:hypothetical protein
VSIDRDDPLLRLRDLFNRYEAVTYALYRTDIMRQVLCDIQLVSSLLARELLSGALTVVTWKVARLPLFYYGRSMAPSALYEHWHPIDFMLSAPEQLFAEYATSRQILCERFQKNGYRGYSTAKLLHLIDLIHMKYLSEYVTPDIMDYLIDEVTAGTDRQQIMQGVWPKLTPSASPVLTWMRSSKLLRKLRDHFSPGLRLHHVSQFFRTAEDRKITTTTVGGHTREYLLYKGFLTSFAKLDQAGPGDPIDDIIRALNAYE